MSRNEYVLGSVSLNQPRGGGPGSGGGRMRVAEKPKNFKNAWKMIFGYCKNFLPAIIIALACCITGVILTLFGPDRLSRVTDLIEAGMKVGSIDIPAVVEISVQLILLYVLSAVLTYTETFMMATVTQKLMKRMRGDIEGKINRVPLSRFDTTAFGDLLSRVTNDVDTIGMSLNNAMVEVITATVTFVGTTVLMLLTSVPMAITALAASIGGFVGMRIIITRSQKYFSRRQRYLGELNGHIEEMYAGHRIVKAYNGEDEAAVEFDRLNELLYENNWKSQFLSGIMHPLMDFIGNLGYVAVCVVGALLAKNGAISFSAIVAFIVYVKLFTQPLGQVAQAATELQSAAAAGERVFMFLDEKEMEDESHKPRQMHTGPGRVVFDHVRFGYDPEKPVIKDFSAVIEPGQKVAIVGPTGAGKTTLVNLLMRFYELDGGSISVDGVKTTDMTRENVHRLFDMVLQDTWLFEGTIRENIVYSMENVSQQQVEEACRAVGLHSYISTLPLGYDTVLNDNTNLSAGQQQLMTIARAMIEDSPLLILDEATSSVDTRTEVLVQQAMEKLTQGRTSFTIAHRLSTIRSADVILVMRDGDIVEKGSHDQLLAKNGFYAELWRSQFEGKQI